MDEFNKLVDIVEILRSEKGCAWDRAQKITNLKTHLLEEVYELIDAIEGKNTGKIKEELGDLFLLLVFITRIFSEKSKFRIKDVLKIINNKLVSRHPHVFSSKKLKNKKDILKHWIKSKAKVKKRKTVYERLPKSSPSLFLAYMLFREKIYLGEKITIKDLKKGIKESLGKLDLSDRYRETVLEIILKLSEFSARSKLNLELSLRRKIFREARKIEY